MAFEMRERSGDRGGERGGERGERGGDRDKEIKRKYRTMEELESLNLGDKMTLEKFVTEHGKILPIRLTGANSKWQRRIKNAVKRARSAKQI
jgi:small subunit ribosomal protein S18